MFRVTRAARRIGTMYATRRRVTRSTKSADGQVKVAEVAEKIEVKQERKTLVVEQIEKVSVRASSVKRAKSAAAAASADQVAPKAKKVKKEKSTNESKATAKKKQKTAKVVKHTPPKDWEEKLNLMISLRKERNAPVDSMGAESLIKRDGEYQFHTLMALMLSSQTKDQVVAETMRRLHDHGLTVENISKTDPEMLNSLINKVGFHNNKTKYIKQAVDIIQTKHSGKVPGTLEHLLELPGVGPKMAFLVLNIAFEKHDMGIAVDTHMHRMCNQLGWAKSKTPEETRLQLESWLPKEHWKDINLIMVGIGQMVQQPAHRTQLITFVKSWKNAEEQKKAIALLKKFGIKPELLK